MDIDDLIGKKVKATKPNGTFVLGLLVALNATHATIKDVNTQEMLLLPIAMCEFKEAW